MLYDENDDKHYRDQARDQNIKDILSELVIIRKRISSNNKKLALQDQRIRFLEMNVEKMSKRFYAIVSGIALMLLELTIQLIITLK